MNSIKQVIDKATVSLQSLSDSPKREACLLLAHALNKSYEDIYFMPEELIRSEDEEKFTVLLQRRLRHEPLSKIRGFREFWSLPFRVTQDTLDPRPDSETLIEAVIDCFPDKAQSLKILDLGTGSGCLLLSVLHEYPNSQGIGVDRSEAAALVAQENAHELNLSNRAKFIVGDWGQALKGDFDIIVSNPPYIKKSDALPLEVKDYDPQLALYAGEDGLEAYRALACQIHNLASGRTRIILEVGINQIEDIKAIFFKCLIIKTRQDMQGKVRCLVLGLNPSPVDSA